MNQLLKLWTRILRVPRNHTSVVSNSKKKKNKNKKSKKTHTHTHKRQDKGN